MNSPITKLSDGRYTVGQMIGTGGMADVYLGLDTRLDREVAIKVLLLLFMIQVKKIIRHLL